MSGGKNGQFGLEALENRRLLSGTSVSISHGPTETGQVIERMTVLVKGLDGSVFEVSQSDLPHLTHTGTLVIDGSSNSDRIGVSLGDGVVNVTLSRGSAKAFRVGYAAGDVKRILVEAGSGNDHVDVAADIGRNCILLGGGGHDTLVGTAGDTLIGGSGNDQLMTRFVPSRGITFNGAASHSAALLSGGDGNDGLFASGNDTVVGGTGDDLAVYMQPDNAFLPIGTDPIAYARDAFGPRASGIEHFDTTPGLGSVRVVSSGPTFSVTRTGTLVVHGTDADDTIFISYNSGKLILNAAGNGVTVTEGFTPHRIKRIRIEAGAGDDHVLMPQSILTRQPATLVGGAGNDDLVGASGNVLIGGGGNDKLHVLPESPSIGAADAVLPAKISPNGPSVLSGGAGNDTLVADSSDSVIGGRGDDLVIEHVYYGVEEGVTTLPHLADDLDAYARQQFGERAIGVEHFDVSIELQPQVVVRLFAS